METEAREAPAVAAKLAAGAPVLLGGLAARLRQLRPHYAITAGRGSSGAAGLLAKYLFEERLGLPTTSAAPSVQSIYHRSLELSQALVLVISQSGRSPDLVEFCRAASGPSVLRVGMVNDIASPLAGAVDVSLPLMAGPETSVAATKSCLAAMLMVFGLTAHWRGDDAMLAAFARAPKALADALAQDWSSADTFLDGEGPIYVVGRGPGFAIAKEGALKLKETNALHAEAVSAAEIRHGPYALVGPKLRVVMFAQRDAALEGQLKLKADLEARGSPVMLISPGSATKVAPDDEPVIELIGMLARFYVFASQGAVRRGRSPDAPPMLSKITETR
jgi:glucosamine--fructose-6-phosphate aminotransferase (isomerizing)